MGDLKPVASEAWDRDVSEAAPSSGPGSVWNHSDWSEPTEFTSVSNLDTNSSPGDVSLLAEGGERTVTILVADSMNHRIVRTRMDGSGWSTLGTSGSGEGQFSCPADVSFDAATGHLYIADDTNHRIVRTKIDGSDWASLGSFGWGEGQFRNPRGIFHDPSSGYNYVADLHGARLVRTGIDGSGWLTLSGEVPLGVHYDGDTGHLYYSDQMPGYPGGSIARTKMDGSDQTVFNPVNAGVGELSGSCMIHWDEASGYIFIADSSNDRVVRTRMDGSGWLTLGAEGDGEGQFNDPTGVCYDPVTGFLYVSDQGNHRLVRTRIDGSGWATLGSFGDGTGQFKYPFGVELVIESTTSHPQEGQLVSRPHDCVGAPRFGYLRWNATVPDDTRVRFQLRTAPSEEALPARPFLGPDGTAQTYYETPGSVWSGHDGDRWVQYRLHLSTSEATASPVLHGLTIAYNCAPDLVGPSVSPPSGDVTTDFNLTVEYSDTDTDPVAIAMVTVDGATHALESASMPGGAVGLWYRTKLSVGDHEYNFSVSDGQLWCHTAKLTLSVDPGPVDHIEVVPGEVSLTSDEWTEFTATPRDVAGNVLSVEVEWHASGGGTIDQEGRFDAAKVGRWTVWANASGVSGVAVVEVNPGDLARVEVLPPRHNMTADDAATFTAMGFDSDGNEVGTSPQWGVTGGGFIDQGGRFDPAIAGNWSILAVDGDVTGEASVQVSAGRLYRVVVTPPGSRVTADDRLQLSARGYDADGNEVEVKPAWSVSGGGTIDQAGLFDACSTGEWTVKADQGGVSGSSSVVVGPGALHRIAVIPEATVVNVSKSVWFVATAYDADGNELEAEFEWSASGGGFVTGSGSFLASSLGEWRVYANASGVSGEASVSVTGSSAGGGGGGGDGADTPPTAVMLLAVVIAAIAAGVLLLRRRG